MNPVANVRSVLVFLASALLGGSMAYAQDAAVPTSEQLEIFRSLTPDQQQSILEQLGNRGADGAQGRNSSDRRDERSRETPGDARRRQDNPNDDADDYDDRNPAIPVFRPEDTLLLDVGIRQRKFIPSVQPGADGTPRAAAVAPGTGAPNAAISAVPGRWEEAPVLSGEERKKLEELIDLMRSRNPYQLDRNGILTLPGFSGIPLAGLNDAQATLRLSAEPALANLDVKVTRLPLAKIGLERMKRFGYELFDNAPSTFSPVTDVPVPADYVVGPGDELTVQLYGSQNRNVPLVVGRDGRVNFPQIGPIAIGGLTFNAARAEIEGRVQRQMIGVNASVSLRDVRSIRVFVLGEARRPGSYTVSGLATITSALFASGGVKPFGSLRGVQLKRQGAVIRTLDLYDLLINGDTSDDAKLLPGDAIFIPPVGRTVTVDGEVHRPAIYEAKGDDTIADVVRMAGGVTPDADPNHASLERVDDAGRRIVQDIRLSDRAAGTVPVRNGDVLHVGKLRPTLDSGIVLRGAVFRPGPRAWRAGLRLSDVITSIDELQIDADPGYVLVRRELPPDRRVSVLSADLRAALAATGSPADIVLQPRDQITVFDLEPGRERVIKPILDELRLQSAIDRPTEVVRVDGSVKVPGEYPLEPDMRITDLLRAGGNLATAAYGGEAELARYSVVNGESRRTDLIRIDLAAIRNGDPAANVVLQPFDHLVIKETPDWDSQESVMLEGEVRFPGKYPIRHGETLHDLLIRAGGLTDLAFPQGSVFTRIEVREREQRQLDLLTERMQADVTTLSLQTAAANQAGASQALQAGQQLLGQLRNSKAVGRVVIDLPAILAENIGSSHDISLKEGDRLMVPRQRQEVTVIGEVQSVTSHLYRQTLDLEDYIGLSGGTTRKADKGKIYVVRTDGSVLSRQHGWFRRTPQIAIMPGDTIVVPLDTERLPGLPFWQAVTQIVYNLAVSVAAITSFR